MMKYLSIVLFLASCSGDNEFRKSHFLLSHVMRLDNDGIDTLEFYKRSEYSLDVLYFTNLESFSFYYEDELIHSIPSGETAFRSADIQGGYSISSSVYFYRNDSLVLLNIRDTLSGESLSLPGIVVLDYPFEGLNYFRSEGE